MIERSYHFGTVQYHSHALVLTVVEGYNFGWTEGKIIMEDALALYTDNRKVTYISNRENSYSLKPADWLKLMKTRERLNAYFIVGKAHNSLLSIPLERMFLGNIFKTFKSLPEALEASKQLQQGHFKKL